MEVQSIDWAAWRQFFTSRSARPLPKLGTTTDYTGWPASLAKSLAIFQLGESGGGTVVEQVRHSRITEIDDNYADAMALFVKEENRHANILAMCVRLLGGDLIRENWTARLFVASRRLMGVRFKVIILLAAEVVGICYYHLLSNRMPACEIREWLSELVEDEKAHLHFHCSFLRSQTSVSWRRWIFVVVWRGTMLAAAIAVMIDHRAAIRDMGIGFGTVWTRWMLYSKLAEQQVINSGKPECRTQHSFQ